MRNSALAVINLLTFIFSILPFLIYFGIIRHHTLVSFNLIMPRVDYPPAWNQIAVQYCTISKKKVWRRPDCQNEKAALRAAFSASIA